MYPPPTNWQKFPVPSITASVIWSYQVPSGQQVYSTPILTTLNDVPAVIFQGWDWYLYAISAANESLIWRYPFGGSNYGRAQAAVLTSGAQTTIFGASHEGYVYSLSSTGTKNWDFANAFTREGSGTVTSATTTSLSDTTKTWVVGEFLSPRAYDSTGATVTITGGTGSGESSVIQSITPPSTLVVSPAWTTKPNTTSTYSITPAVDSDIYYQHAGTLSLESGTYYLYVTGFDGLITKLNASTGALIWKYSAHENNEPYPLLETINGTLYVYFASVDGYVYCLNASTGALLWSTMPETISSSPMLDAFLSAGDVNDDGSLDIVVASRSTRVFVLNALTGATEATSSSIDGDTYAGIDNEPVLIPQTNGIDNIVYGTHSGFVYCINDTGETIWRKNLGVTINASIQYADIFNIGTSYLVVSDMGGAITILNPDNGATIGTFNVKGGIEGTPMIADVDGSGKNELLLTTLDGYVELFNVSL
ncbi:Outer membrane protein assembly factor BamB [uncultured archaeon]|nr:Outer membrane protein assembly factor BamB [uncultured archaeon]